MPFGAILQPIFGCIFIYLTLALFASEIQEQISTFFEFRAEHLKDSIKQLLDETDVSVLKQEVKIYKCQESEPNLVVINEDYIFPQGENNDKFIWIFDKQDNEASQEASQLEYADNDIERLNPSGEVIQSSDSDYKITTKGRVKKNITIEVTKFQVQEVEKDVKTLTDLLYKQSQLASLNQKNRDIWSFLGFSKNKYHKILFILLALVGFGLTRFIDESIWENAIFIGLVIIAIIVSFLIKTRINKKPIFYSEYRKSIGFSYIEPPELFGKTLIEVIQNNSQKILKEDSTSINNVITALQTMTFWSPAQKKLIEIAEQLKLENKNKLTDFETELTNLFKATQQRSSGTYKRNAKGVSLILGLIIAVVANADVFNIFATLSKNSNVSNSTIDKLKQNVQDSECYSKTALEREQCETELASTLRETFVDSDVILPLGWNFEERKRIRIRSEETEKQLQIEDINKRIPNLNNLISNLDKTTQCIGKNNDSTTLKLADVCIEKFASNLSLNNPPIADSIISDLKIEVETWEVETWDNDSDYNKNLEKYKKKLKKEILSLQIEKLKLEQEPKKPSPGSSQVVNKNNDSATKSIEGEQEPTPTTDSANLGNRINNSFQEIETLFIDSKEIIDEQGGYFKVGLGWFISAIAISMGAPFWFDLLARVMNVRNAGKPPEAN